MRRKHELVGKTFGRWYVAGDDGALRSNGRVVVCTCRCGITRTVRVANLISGGSRSCGCLRQEFYQRRKPK